MHEYTAAILIPPFFQGATIITTSRLLPLTMKPLQMEVFPSVKETAPRGASPDLEIIKKSFMLNSGQHEIFLLINVKMPTIVGILTFMSRKNNILD